MVFIVSYRVFLDFIYLFLEKEEGRGKSGKETSVCERNINWLPLTHAPMQDQARNPGMYPD